MPTDPSASDAPGAPVPDRAATPTRATKPPAPASDRVLCDRCGAEMFRMHAVWRCPECGYKTDCCGW